MKTGFISTESIGEFSRIDSVNDSYLPHFQVCHYLIIVSTTQFSTMDVTDAHEKAGMIDTTITFQYVLDG